MDTTTQQGTTGQQPPIGSFPGGPPGAGVRGGRGGLMFLGPYGSIIAIALLGVTYLIMAISMYQFLKKSGLTPWVAILMLVPVVNLGVALWAAFTKWPVLKEIDRLKMLVATSNLVAPGTSESAGGEAGTGAAASAGEPV